MATSRLALRAFLSQAKALLKKPQSQTSKPVTFVIGNESADLDSICCAVVYAYLKTSTPPYTFHIPLSNIPSSDLSLRPELIPVLSKANLQSSDLITLSELDDSHTTSPSKDNAIVLVDHNALTGPLARSYSEYVVGCIDHHEDEGVIPTTSITSTNSHAPRVIEKSGSCMSLVITHCQEAWKSLSRDEIDDQLAHLAMAPILIDTNNLKDENKTKKQDLEASLFLEGLLNGSGYSRQAYFEEISTSKQDIGSLSLNDIFRKDYKMWEEKGMKLGVSSVVKDMSFLVDKAGDTEGYLDAIEAFAQERQLSIFAIMTTFTAGDQFQRELFLWGRDEKGRQAAERFEVDNRDELCLEELGQVSLHSSNDDVYRRCWNQGSLTCSRKQVGPMIRRAMKEF